MEVGIAVCDIVGIRDGCNEGFLVFKNVGFCDIVEIRDGRNEGLLVFENVGFWVGTAAVGTKEVAIVGKITGTFEGNLVG